MPDPDQHGRNDSGEKERETRNLPMVVPRPSEIAREPGEGFGETFLARLVRAMFGWKPGSIRADLQVVLEGGGTGETGFSPTESTMLKNILGLRERRIEDVMVPRADIVAVQQEISLGDLIKVFEGAGHSRLVAYDDTLDDPIGMVHIRDLIAFMTRRAEVKPETNARRRKPLPAGLDLKAIDLSMPLKTTRIVRPILFVPPSMPAIDLLAKMQATHIHLALVIDEYGGTDGLVSIEDIVEEVVGEIEDEHDEASGATVVAQPDGSYLADARASLEDVTSAVGVEFDVGEAAEEVDTIGGYLMAQVGRLPVRGELVPGPGPFEIEVLDADPRRVKRLRIYRSKPRLLGSAGDGARGAALARSGASDATRADPSPPTAIPPKSAQRP